MKPFNIVISASLAVISSLPALAAQPVSPSPSVTPSSAATATQTAADSVLTVVDGAVQPDQVPRREVVWRFFSRVHAIESHQAGKGVAFLEKALQWQPAQAQAVVAYINDTFSRREQFTKSQLNSFCNETLDTQDINALGARLTARNDASDTWRETQVAGLATVLDAATLSRLDQWLNSHVRNKLSVVTANYSKYLARPGALSDLVERRAVLCSTVQP